MKSGLVTVRFKQDWRGWQANKVYEVGKGVANELCNNAHVAEYHKEAVAEVDAAPVVKPMATVKPVAKPTPAAKPKWRRRKRALYADDESN